MQQWVGIGEGNVWGGLCGDPPGCVLGIHFGDGSSYKERTQLKSASSRGRKVEKEVVEPNRLETAPDLYSCWPGVLLAPLSLWKK